ncbi:hypothetical protein KAS14_01705 [Candidatus Bathyarchaeota archaeon]|nr:hypothetical protein [Candidatus Bathyarchaeota archaeon]
MSSIPISGILHDSWLILLLSLVSIIAVTMVHKRMKKHIAIAISLATSIIAALTIPDLFSKYIIDLTHVLNHIMLTITFLLCARLLIVENAIAKTVTFLSDRLRRTHTGNLNLNMLALLLYFLSSLIFFFVIYV